MRKNQIIFLIVFLFGGIFLSATAIEDAASASLTRLLGDVANRFELIEETNLEAEHDAFKVVSDGEKVVVRGNSAVALVRGAYDYLRNGANSIIGWNGDAIRISADPSVAVPEYEAFVKSPYETRYFYNVVTAGYTSPYWQWDRWEREIDWLATRGVNLPLIGGAHEAILYRVWRKLGLTEEEAMAYFTGPAHFPWNRMGNITKWDGPFPLSYFDKQVDLTHKMLDRMDELGMEPIVHAFAGFVPAGLKRIYPELKLLDLRWGGFEAAYSAQILTPDNELFAEIGTIYIQEWEKEFGKGVYYLADSFNEMDVPVSGSMEDQKKQLADFGYMPYKAIMDANPDAVWVMQGWTFPFHLKDGKIYWTAERLEALLSKVPDDKLLVLDMANEYNAFWWKIDPSWKMYDGFFGKKWVYSFIPNMGGKVDFTGHLDFYATAPIEALNYAGKGNLFGYGTAPEATENNEVVYELIMDMGWRDTAIDTTEWLKDYYSCRYGKLTPQLEEAIDLLHKSAYSDFTDHPRRSWQFKRNRIKQATGHRSPEFLRSIELFLSCSSDFKDEPLYVADMLELAAFYLGCYAEDKYLAADWKIGKAREKAIAEVVEILNKIDALLTSHPVLKLEDWVDYARSWGDTETEKNYYESNAKRLVTTWGGDIDEYSARIWSGLIRDYYVPRMELEQQRKRPAYSTVQKWEEEWIKTPGLSEGEKLENPLEKAIEWCSGVKIKQNRRVHDVGYRPFG